MQNDTKILTMSTEPTAEPRTGASDDMVLRWLRNELSEAMQFGDSTRSDLAAAAYQLAKRAVEPAARTVTATPSPREPRELLCMKCGHDYPVWFAPSPAWNAVVRRADGSDEWPFLCPTCFTVLAVAHGYDGRWAVLHEPSPREPDAEQTPCLCVDVDIGTHSATVGVVTPEHMRGRNYGCYTMRDVLDIDACVVAEIAALWREGITTTGSCCGHNKLPGYIGVAPEDVSRMEAMGYAHCADPSTGEAHPEAFVPRWLRSTGERPKVPYSIQTIPDVTSPTGGHYRITDADDNRVATSYLYANAVAVCDALNARAGERPVEDAGLRTALANIRDLARSHKGASNYQHPAGFRAIYSVAVAALATGEREESSE